MVYILYPVHSAHDSEVVILLIISINEIVGIRLSSSQVFHPNSDEIFPYFIFLSALKLFSPRLYDCFGQFSHGSCFIYETSRDYIAAFSVWLNFFWWGKLPASHSEFVCYVIKNSARIRHLIIGYKSMRGFRAGGLVVGFKLL